MKNEICHHCQNNHKDCMRVCCEAELAVRNLILYLVFFLM